MAQVTPEDLRRFGLIPEFVGRLPVVVSVEQLDEGALRCILTDPKNALLKQYQKLLKYDGVDLSFSDDAVAEIARYALLLGTGARGLRSIVERVMAPILFDPAAYGKKVLVDGQMVRRALRTVEAA